GRKRPFKFDGILISLPLKRVQSCYITSQIFTIPNLGIRVKSLIKKRHLN
ncbi:MAG: hypothetical protein ACI9D5_001827, partial [Candidatus Endobugula sp.]